MLWEQKLLEVDQFRDGMGKGVDPGIRETVAVLQLLSINTTASCEGHLDHGIAAPWIDIESPDPRVKMYHLSLQEVYEKADAIDNRTFRTPLEPLDSILVIF